MKRISLLEVLFAGVLASSLLAVEGPNTLDLSGREVVVRVFRGRPQERMDESERATLVIERRTIRFDLEDVNDSTLFKILAEDQKDQLVRQVIDEGGFSWRYQQGTGFYLPISAAELDGRVAVVRVRKNRKSDADDLREVMTKGRTIKFDFTDLNEASRVYVFGRDQKDEVIRLVTSERHFSHAYAKGLEYSLPTTLSELSSRELIVRVYRNWVDEPSVFEKWAAPIYKRDAEFDFTDVNESAVVAVFGVDQEDEVLRKLIGNRVYGWAYKKRLEFSLPDRAPTDQNDYCWTFVDALGNAIPNADVQMYLTHEGRRIFIAKGRLDGDARWKTPFCVCDGIARVGGGGFGTTLPLFVFSHRDYGIVEAKLFKADRKHENTATLPFVPPGSEAEQRCAWGVVVDPENNPVSGATVEASGVYPPGGDWIGRSTQCCVRTDEQGRFRIYMPIDPSIEKIGLLIPPKSEYSVRVTPRNDLGLVKFSGKIPNGQASIITLERVSGYFHTFAFEDESGPITDRNLFYTTGIKIRRKNASDVYLTYEKWKNGGVFPLGTYEVDMSGHREGEFRFEPIEVTADSSEELVFKPVSSPAKRYYGRVVNGISGEPMQGVFVADLTGGSGITTPLEVTPEQWYALHELTGANSISEESSKNITNFVRSRRSGRISWTDKDGRFELSRPGERIAYKFLVFEQNYLPVLIENDLFKEDPEGNFELPPTRMFPAVRVIVELYCDEPQNKERTRHGYPDYWPEWIVELNNNPAWARELLAACIDDFREGIQRDFDLDVNRGPGSFYVPAELNLQIQLRPWMRVAREETGWAPMTVGDNIKLEQGEVLDLGRVQIKRALTIFADITNLVGEPVEGVPVAACDQYGRTTSNTDANGIAIFGLARNSKGEFVVEYNAGGDANEPHLREALPYKITSPEDANTVFTLRVSDEMLYNLFK